MNNAQLVGFAWLVLSAIGLAVALNKNSDKARSIAAVHLLISQIWLAVGWLADHLK